MTEELTKARTELTTARAQATRAETAAETASAKAAEYERRLTANDRSISAEDLAKADDEKRRALLLVEPAKARLQQAEESYRMALAVHTAATVTANLPEGGEDSEIGSRLQEAREAMAAAARSAVAAARAWNAGITDLQSQARDAGLTLGNVTQDWPVYVQQRGKSGSAYDRRNRQERLIVDGEAIMPIDTHALLESLAATVTDQAKADR
ncbi:hypothetical protein IM660_06845 [Ruania alkalisoli]|uniref:Uncharacterized protein n=1 Tax=Ruania alkalisoli TaxID=2779775 RepID=A0A7M1SWL4_9MICO|nr:hypothetical protein [Ruania alkalisoli]QOR71959.1 hypothetical protein IM660_06845 [Ruania alkalisoli]